MELSSQWLIVNKFFCQGPIGVIIGKAMNEDLERLSFSHLLESKSFNNSRSLFGIISAGHFTEAECNSRSLLGPY